MIACPACSSRVDEDSRFCGSCGTPLPTTTDSPTRTELQQPGAPPPAGAVTPHSLPSREQARFLPGMLIGQRYRVVGLLGRGGMGEVYRADDLKLGRPVALKFLPTGLESDERRLERFLNEVRVALRVSHPNVCRVHDIGEIEGQHYLSMEYVDGEDLASLLRRIGRFPPDKAVQVARQLCAGLAAAHEQGVLHRDLKPANVMIDGRGQVKITDFGLAALATEVSGAEVRAGTPQYMAPEQWAGREVTVRSDLYALGLVLYELFTGRAAFSGRTPLELSRQHQETAPESPASLIDNLDPAVERVILRCLEKDPLERPRSALAVAAALPGGDPLAAALAAGETPSPELVAQAGGQGGLSPGQAGGALAAVVAAVLLLIGLAGSRQLINVAPLEKPPEVLRERARQIIRDLGYTEPPADSLFTFLDDGPLVNHAAKLPPEAARRALGASRPASILFWYRQSPQQLVRGNAGSIGGWLGDPPPTLPGMVTVGLDPEGRLHSLHAVPQEKLDAEDPPSAAAPEPDWAAVFAAAGLDPAAFTPVPPQWTPPVYADRRVAWEGSYPESPDVPIRLEAAAFAGRPVALRTVAPWDRPFDPVADRPNFWTRLSRTINSVWFVVVVVSAGLVAWRNLRLGRGDRKGALRFALYLGAVRLLWLLGADHVASAAEIDVLVGHLAWSSYRVCLAWIFYLALEPYARRLWPRMLASWVRLFNGRFRDPLVGRDLLVGCLFGTVFASVIWLAEWVPEQFGRTIASPHADLWSLQALRGARRAIAALFGIHVSSVLNLLVGVMLFLVLRLLLRRTAPAVVLMTVLAIAMFNPQWNAPWVFLIGISINMVLFWLVLFRFGLLPVLLGASIADVMVDLPLTLDPSSWYVGSSLLALGVTLGIAGWGFWTSLAGRPLFRDEFAEATATVQR